MPELKKKHYNIDFIWKIQQKFAMYFFILLPSKHTTSSFQVFSPSSWARTLGPI